MECPECGNRNRRGARFCDRCGARLGGTEAAGSDAGGSPAASVPGNLRPAPADAPERVGGRRFEVVGFLGEGTRKRVYLARDHGSDGGPVAVAVFSTEGMAAAAQARARREAEAMAALGDHPKVVPVLTSGQDGDRPFIAYRYMPGGDLHELLDASPGRRLEPTRALEIAADVAAGLAHAHAQGIVHRDIKPANVWLDGDGSARIGDFGLAAGAVRSREAVERMVVGTAAYLPPEQAIGRRTDARADLYSLGAVLYEMLVGEAPFPGDDPVSIISSHLSTAPVPPSRHVPEVGPAIDAVVIKLLAKSPEDRFVGAGQLESELERLAAEPEAEGEAEGEANPLDALAGGVFVGRDAELESLRGLVEGALAGRGTVALLEGEPGIGKTSLTEELVTYSRVRGATALTAACHEAGATPAYWPFVQLVRAYVRDADPVGLAWQLGPDGPELARLVPELTEIVPAIAEPGAIESDEARFRFFEAVAGFLVGVSRSRPLVLAIDDLHWADPSSLELLRFLSRRLADSALLIVCAYRPEEARERETLRRALGELDEVPGRTRLSLSGLEAEAIGRYVELTTGEPPRPELIAEISQQTGGNPFFVGEVVRLMATEGPEPDGPDRAIPEGVSEAVRRRLDRLDDSARAALEVAAVLGREFERRLLEEVAEPGPGAVEQAVAARILERRGGDRYMFTHAVFREVLIDLLPEQRRLELHEGAGAAIERIYADRLDEHLPALARHYLTVARSGAGDDLEARARAREYLLAAGRQAAGRLAHADAAEQLALALELSDAGDRAAELALRLELGEEMTRGGRFFDARSVLVEAAGLARELDDVPALAEAAFKVAALGQVGVRDAEIEALLNDALALVPDADISTRARLTAALARETYWEDHAGEAERLSREAVALARESGDPGALAPALAVRQFVDAGLPGKISDRLRNAEELLEVARAAGDRESEVRAHAYRLTSQLQNADVAGADRSLAEYTKLAERLGEPRHLWHVPVIRASRALMAGRIEEAKRLSEEGRRLGELAEEPLSVQFHTIQMSLILTYEGSPEEMLPVVRRMVDQYPAIPAWRLALAAFLVEAERIDEARAEFEPIAARGFDAIPRDANWLIGLARIGEVAARLGESEVCGDLLERLRPFSGEVVVVGRAASCVGPLDRYLGLMAAASGEVDRAIDYLESSLATIERMGDRPARADGNYQLGRALLIRGAEGDRDRALDALSAALEEAQELGMRGYVERSVRLRLEAQGAVGVDAGASIDSVALAVADERPDLVSVASADGRVTILFSDIENSTLMTERLGDDRWIEVLREHNSIFRRRLDEFGGTEVKNQGDGFMLVFPDPAAALECALEVQGDFAGADERPESERIRVRIGMHVGEVIEEEGDFFGRSVILAARVAAQAKGGEILISEALSECGAEGYEFRAPRELELKGLAGTHRVFSLGRADRPQLSAAANA